MNQKIEEVLRKNEYHIQDGGDGIFVCLKYEPSTIEEEWIEEEAKKFYDDVNWCPDPESHGEEFYAVLNCFYPVQRGY
jgi:hypothetical protein